MPSKKFNKNARSRGWCYTVNNYTDDDIADCMSLYEDDTNATYQIIGFEKGDRKGVEHLQCYIHYREAVSWSVMRKRLYPNHVEPQKSHLNCFAYCYCMDGGNYYEQGEVPRQGHRTDLEVIRHRLDEGVPLRDLKKQYFSQWCQYRRAFNEYIDDEKDAKRKSSLLVIYDRECPISLSNLKPYFTGKYLIFDGLGLPYNAIITYYKNIYDYIIIDDSPSLTKYLDVTDSDNNYLINFIRV